MRRTAASIIALLAATASFVALPAAAAPPAVPTQIGYQGVLLDNAGAPKTGNVDLTLRIYDAPGAGTGTLLYKQVFTNVALTDGVFSVRLGPTGVATDVPASPLTTSLQTALAGDLAATGPARFLEVTVGGSGPLLRSQLVASPYAVRAATADAAETAAVATTAQTADNVTSVNGLPSTVLNRLYQFGNTDNSGPINSDPSEGIADVDGDGLENFVDTDNDADTLSDTTEVSQGSNLNVVTPILSSLSPTTGPGLEPVPVTLNGANFSAGATVTFGQNVLVPGSLTPTSMVVQPPGPQLAGAVSVFVTLPNAEHSLSRPFTFTTPSASELSTDESFAVRGAAVQLRGRLGGYLIDADGDGTLETSQDFHGPNLGSVTPRSETAVAWAPTGQLVGVRCRDVGGGVCDLEFVRDTDADLVLAADAATPLGVTLTGSGHRLWSPSIAFDGSGRTVIGLVTRDGSSAMAARVYYDRNGDGDFADAQEAVLIETAAGTSPASAGKIVVDASGRVAYAYNLIPASSQDVRLAFDANGDGDFADTVNGNPERFTAVTLSPTSQSRCTGVGFDSAGHLAVVASDSSATVMGLRLVRDGNGDGDFADPNEVVTIAAATTACDVVQVPGAGLAIAHGAGGTKLLFDRNDDGDFADANEDLTLSVTAPVWTVVTVSGTGKVWVAGPLTQTFPDPF